MSVLLNGLFQHFLDCFQEFFGGLWRSIHSCHHPSYYHGERLTRLKCLVGALTFQFDIRLPTVDINLNLCLLGSRL